MIRYKYELVGTGKVDDTQTTWTVTGHVETEKRGDFAVVPDMVMIEGFALGPTGSNVY